VLQVVTEGFVEAEGASGGGRGGIRRGGEVVDVVAKAIGAQLEHFANTVAAVGVSGLKSAWRERSSELRSKVDSDSGAGNRRSWIVGGRLRGSRYVVVVMDVVGLGLVRGAVVFVLVDVGMHVEGVGEVVGVVETSVSGRGSGLGIGGGGGISITENAVRLRQLGVQDVLEFLREAKRAVVVVVVVVGLTCRRGIR